MTHARLSISVNVDCPRCKKSTDLMDEDENNGINEEGHISNQALPEGNWHEKHREFKAQVLCCHCGNDFTVKGLDW